MSERDADDTLDTLPQVDLRIPGPWGAAAELAEALADVTDEYVFDNDALHHTPTGRQFKWGVTEHDDDIAGVFAGGGRITPEQVEEIASHSVKIHLSGRGGSVEAVHALMLAAAAVVRAGGFGVMVDNSGCTHNPQDWLDLAEGGDPAGGAYWACVAMTAGRDEAFSSGMHCLGLRDAEMDLLEGDREATGFFLHNFLGYTLQSGAAVLDGDRLGDEQTALFHVRHKPCTRFAAGTPWFNPYGVWRLEPEERLR